MHHLVLELYSWTIQFYAERDLKLTSLSAIISPYLPRTMHNNKLNTAFLREILLIFLQFTYQRPLM